jgi:hypothetical protein
MDLAGRERPLRLSVTWRQAEGVRTRLSRRRRVLRSLDPHTLNAARIAIRRLTTLRHLVSTKRCVARRIPARTNACTAVTEVQATTSFSSQVTLLSRRARWSPPRTRGELSQITDQPRQKAPSVSVKRINRSASSANPSRERFICPSTPATRTERRINRSPLRREKLHRAVDPLLPADSQHPGAVDPPAPASNASMTSARSAQNPSRHRAHSQINRVRPRIEKVATAGVTLQPAKLVRFITPPANHTYCWNAHYSRSSVFHLTGQSTLKLRRLILI